MSKGEQPRDWDRELAAIDKIIASGPPVPAAQPAAAPKGGRAPAAPGRYAVLFTWVRLGLGLSLGAAMTQWPYTHGCGLPLFVYLGAVCAVLVAGVWSSVSSWKTRSGFAHFLSVALILWGGVLAAREVLPRIGYAEQSAEWVCRVPSGMVL
ncbi:MAG: hypothetical protein AAB409_00285 [Gemmatimonadota bacterium]